jgi:YihY family inner membrane protein
VHPRALAGALAGTHPVRVASRFVACGGGSQAIVIAWNLVLAVFPIALALAAIGGFVLRLTGVSPDTIARQVVAVFPTDTGAQDAALRGIDALTKRTAIFAGLAIMGFAWTASGLFGAMDEAFAVVFDTKPRPFARQKLMALAMMGLFALMALLSVGTSALLPLLADVPGLPISLTRGWAGTAVQVTVGMASGFVLFFVIYFVVPNRRMRAARVWPGALFAGVALELLSQLFPIYIELNPGINQFGRSFALLFVLLTFAYLLGVITMLGAYLIAVLDPPEPEPVPPPEPTVERRPPIGRVRRAALGAAGLLAGLALAGRPTRRRT